MPHNTNVNVRLQPRGWMSSMEQGLSKEKRQELKEKCHISKFEMTKQKVIWKDGKRKVQVIPGLRFCPLAVGVASLNVQPLGISSRVGLTGRLKQCSCANEVLNAVHAAHLVSYKLETNSKSYIAKSRNLFCWRCLRKAQIGQSDRVKQAGRCCIPLYVRV